MTFLFTDVEGSTAMHERGESHAWEAIEALDRVISEVVAKHNGAVILEKGEGDSHFCVFERTSDALTAAISIQTILGSHTWEEGFEVKVRAAIHCGEAELRGRTYYGLPVIRCARLRAVAHGGQTLLSQAARIQIPDSKFEGVKILDLGNHRLKDLQYPERIFQASPVDSPSAFPHLKTPDYHPNNLPMQTTSFLGRVDELDRLSKLVLSHRLVTILGAGGSGKTRLAIQTGVEILDQFAGGCYFLDLIPLKKEAEIQDLAHTVLTGRPYDGTHTGLDADKKYLLVLDNCEHITDEVAKFSSAWLKAHPSTRILATSREILRISGEAQFNLEPLSLPREGASLEECLATEAVQLFIERATLRDEKFRIDEENMVDIANVCRAVDGLPLAIEIAASNIDWATIREISEMFAKNLDALESGTRDINSRHRTLGSVYEWSYELLDPQEKKFLARLGVFPSTWTIEAAAATGRAIDPELGSRLVASLVRKSMVVQVEAPLVKRLRLLETVREFALGKLGHDLYPTRRSFANFFVEYSEGAEAKFRGKDQAKWFQQFELEMPNFQLAFDTLLGSDPTEALALALNLRHFLLRRGLFRLGVDWFERAIPANERGDPYSVALAIRTFATFHWRLGDYDRAAAEFESAIVVFAQLGRIREVAATKHNLGLLYLVQGEFSDSERYLFESAKDYEGIDEPYEKSRVYLSLSRQYLDQNEPDRALEWIAKATLISENLGDEGGLAIAEGNEAEASYQRGEYKAALDSLGNALVRWRSISDHQAFISATIILAAVIVKVGLLSLAKDCYAFVCEESRFSQTKLSSHQESLRRTVAEATGGIGGSPSEPWPRSFNDQLEMIIALQLKAKILIEDSHI